MKTKYVGPLMLPIEVHERLAQMAAAEERDTLQQARWLLRQVLMGQKASEQDAPQEREVAHVGAR